MDALLDCIDEIALDGLDGCPIQHLWWHLEERKPPFPLKLDDTAKQFLWKAIVGIPEVEFFVLPEPYAHIFGTQYDDSSDKDKLKSKNPLDQFQGPLKECNPFKLVCDQESGVRGSCPSYFVRKNVTQEIRDQAEYLSLETSYQRWGDCLVMVASQELREKALLGLHCDPNITLVDMQYCLLEHVGQARYNGRMQRAIGSNFVKTDPKTIFHHLKKLRKEHLITMQPVVITTSVPSSKSQSVRNYNTNIIRLKRFHIQEHHKYDILAASLCKLLLDAPNQELSLFDIQKHTSESKGTLKKVRQFLQQAGYVEEKKVGSTSKTGDEDFQPPKKKKKESLSTPTAQTIKIRLLKPFILRSDSILQPSDEEEEDEDGEDGDNEKDSQGDDYLSNLVAERPVFNQVYDLICQAGSRGYTLRKCQQACKLPFLDVRALVKDMKNRNLIEEVQQDVAKTKINWIVATPFVESNVQTIKVKQMQDQLKQMETKAIEAQAIGGFHAPSEGLVVEERKPVKSKSLIAERVTYRKLKRKHLILEFMENLKVVEGLFPIQKAILGSEEEEGHEGKIDRKVLIRMLDDLIAQGLIRKMTTVIHHGADSQTVDLYLHSSITNDHLAIAQTIEQCRERMRGECYKAEEKQEKKARQMAVEKEKRKLEKAEEKEKKKLQKEKEAQRKAQQEQDKEASKKTVKEQSTAINLNNELPSRKYGFLPRFSRAQALHELLWLLSCDDVTKEILDSADESQMNIDLEGSSDDEWMKHLKPMTKVCDAQGQPLKGWFRFSDVFPVMPLNILCKAVDVTDEIVGLDEYALDPVKKNTLICDLPQPLRSRVTEYRKIRSSAMELLFVMSQMGLVTPALPFPYNFKDIKMFLSKGVKLLDTTSSVRHYHTARPPEGKSFTLRSHMFTSMASVKNYWADLKCVCLNTPLGLVRNREGSGDNKVVVASKNRKLNSFAKEEIDEDWVGLPPGDQLGAGGLDRSLFSHLQKNWTRMAKPRVTIQEKRKLPLSTTIMAAEAEALNSGSSLPQDSEKRFFSLGTAETKKQAKKGREQTKKRKRKADSQESDQVKKRRTASTEKAKNSEEKKSQPHHFRKTGHLAAIDEEDRNVLARKATERISFSPEEDTWLLLFRVALAVMKNETSRFYPFVCMRNILHKACTESFDKTAPSIQRRILRLMKNPHSQMTVKICSIECAHDESFQGFDDPKAEFEATFQEVVRRLRQKFSSSSLSCDGDLPLVSSLKELHDKFKVQALVSKDTMLSDQSIISLGPGIKSVSDINKAAIRDQIQIAFTTPQEMYDAYRVFQMFNSFTREELEDVFKEMQKKNLVSRKKSGENPSKQFTRALPFASITFQLSIAYHRLFLQGFKLITFFRDCKNFWDQLVKGEQHTLQEPRISSSSSSAITNEQTPEVLTPGTLEVKPKSTLGGHVACILSLLTTDKVTVEVRIPDEILNMDPSELTESAENIDTQQQTRQETTDPTAVTSSVSSKQKSSTLSPVKTKALEKAAERSQLSSSTGQSSSSSGKLPAERSETRSAMSSAKAKPQKKGKPGAGTSVTMEKRLHVREVFTLNSPASVTTKFTSAYNLSSVKEKNDYLTSCIEAVEVEQSTSQTVCKVATVPVASLSYNNTSSRSSRTALMLARGGKDPYVSINQLTARAVNTHDFMTLYPCGNVLRIKDDNDGKVPNEKGSDEKSVEKTEVMSVTKSSDLATATPEQSLQKANVLGADSMKSQGASQIVRTSSVCGDSVTAPVLISSAVSLEDYIEQKKRELGFNEMDAALANDIYDLVGEGKEFGVPVTRLQERVHKSHEQKLNSSKYSFEQHIKFLCAAKLLYKVGLYERCLVTASFVKPWSITLLKSISGSQQTLLKAAEPGKDDEEKSLPCTSDSLNTKKNTSNQEEDAESNNSQGIYQGDKNDLQITEIITEDTTSEASQDDSLTAKVINECSATSSRDTDSTHDENNETTDTKGLSSDRLGDLPSKQVDESKARRKKSKISNYESYSVVCRPWITIDGTTSQQLLRMFREMVLMVILDNPGIPESQIAKRVFEALRPVALHDILESLILDGCIVKHVRKLPSKRSLFSSSKQAEPTQTMTFYTPTIDCIFKLATIGPAIREFPHSNS